MRAAVLIAATLALGYLAGCGGSDDSTTAPVTTTVTIPPTTASTTTSASGTTSTTTTGEDPQSTPEPGSGEGAPDSFTAAAAVLTDTGTPEQACGSYVTEAFIQASFGGEANCIAARQGQPPASAIHVQLGTPNGTHLVVVPKGGPYNGAKVEVNLVAEDGTYRVDSLKAHVPAGP